jgi:hypothetical protein
MRAAGVPGRGREREDVQVRKPAVVDDVEGAGEHVLGLGREAGDDVGAEDHVGTQPPHLGAEGNRVAAAVAALHALEDEVVASL